MFYGTMAEMLKDHKERIKLALNGKVKAWDAEPAEATKEECDKAILSIFDAVAYEALGALAAGLVYEQMFIDKIKDMDTMEIVRSMEKKVREVSEGYEYEDWGIPAPEEFECDCEECSCGKKEEESNDGNDA